MPSTPLDPLRHQIAEIDREILRLAGLRLDLAAEIGAVKRTQGLPVRHYGTEAEVLARYRNEAAVRGVDPEVAGRLAAVLIGAAVRLQEEGLGRREDGERSATSPGEICIVGGAGKMGQWFARFFRSQGRQVVVHDPAGGDDEGAAVEFAAVETAAVVVLATPLALAPSVLREVVAAKPRGLVVDISSLKSHLLDDLRQGVAAGIRVASLHPLFGPGAETLAGRVMAICDCGDPGAADEAAALFRDTALTLTRIPVERHDHYMQFVLGLSHLVSLLFAATLVRSGYGYDELAEMASTTFHKQVRTATQVVHENPRLYHEIQRLNRHSPDLYHLVHESLTALTTAAAEDGAGAFERLVHDARAWFPEVLPTDLG